MKNTDIPDGFGAFLQQTFGGTLTAPRQPNPCGHSADYNARLTEIPTAISEADLAKAINEYYAAFGCCAWPTMVHGCFEVKGEGLTLYVALSLYQHPGSDSFTVLLTVNQRE